MSFTMNALIILSIYSAHALSPETEGAIRKLDYMDPLFLQKDLPCDKLAEMFLECSQCESPACKEVGKAIKAEKFEFDVNQKLEQVTALVEKGRVPVKAIGEARRAVGSMNPKRISTVANIVEEFLRTRAESLKNFKLLQTVADNLLAMPLAKEALDSNSPTIHVLETFKKGVDGMTGPLQDLLNDESVKYLSNLSGKQLDNQLMQSNFQAMASLAKLFPAVTKMIAADCDGEFQGFYAITTDTVRAFLNGEVEHGKKCQQKFGEMATCCGEIPPSKIGECKEAGCKEHRGKGAPCVPDTPWVKLNEKVEEIKKIITRETGGLSPGSLLIVPLQKSIGDLLMMERVQKEIPESALHDAAESTWKTIKANSEAMESFAKKHAAFKKGFSLDNIKHASGATLEDLARKNEPSVKGGVSKTDFVSIKDLLTHGADDVVPEH